MNDNQLKNKIIRKPIYAEDRLLLEKGGVRVTITNKVMLTAVHDADLKRGLVRLGLYEGIVKGEHKCFICGKKINMINLGGIFKAGDGKIHTVCNTLFASHGA